MTPSARIQSAIEILQGLGGTAQPVDRFLRDWFRMRRYAGSKDRAAVAERVFSILRKRASLAWRMQSEEPRALAIASLLCEGAALENIEALFGGEGYGPSALSQTERDAIATPLQGPPLYVQGEFPLFLEAELTRAFGPSLLEEMTALQARAPVDLRVNTLKAERGDVLADLKAAGFAAEPTSYSPHGIRIPPGAGSASLSRSPLFESGAFEFQDEAAQIASLLCDAKPGMRILDIAAGAGGKALAFAAEMRNTGEIVASDIDVPKLKQLAIRAERAGATIIHIAATPVGDFDAVFLDAPCSGSGTWRRQPELKWRLTPQRLTELCALQDTLLDAAAKRVKPGGRLVYATCSLLPCENEDRVAAFLARHGDFAVTPAAELWNGAAPPGLERFFKASPNVTGTDGFFAAIIRRNR